MKRMSHIISLILPALALVAKPVLAQQSGEAQLHQLIKESGAEETKAKELEERVTAEKDRYERRVRQVQKEIANQRYQIEGFKMRQDKAQQELESLSVNIGDLDSKLSALSDEKHDFDASTSQTLTLLESQRREAAEKQKALDSEIAELSKARKRAERSIVNKSIEVQTMKADLARLEATRAEIESKTAETEADEMRVRTEWMQTKIQTAEQMKQRDEAYARLAETKKRHDVAAIDLKNAQADLAKAQKERNDAMKRAEGEVAKYEKEIQGAHKARIAAESEQIRLDAEVAKIREYVARMKESHDQAIEQADQSEGLVWKSTLNLETARSELSRAVSGKDKSNFELQKMQNRERGIAAAADAATMVEAAQLERPKRTVAASSPTPSEAAPVQPGKPGYVGQPDPPSMTKAWVTKSSCNAYEKPDKKLKPIGFFNEGQKFMGRVLKTGWVKIQSASGSAVYVEGNCGTYEN